jgi:hypothetical protein
MDIYIDESGSFVCTKNVNSWSVVAAYSTYSSQRKILSTLLDKLKLKCNKSVGDEMKLKNVEEGDLAWFLYELSKLEGTLFCVATDISMVDCNVIENHRNDQAYKVIEHVDRMQHQSMKDSLNGLSDGIKGLSPQLYLQLVCQFTLINDVIRKATLYYSQRRPSILSRFKWSVDQKNSSRTFFENAFEKMAPIMLQTMSLREPFIMLTEGNYSYMSHFLFKNGAAPSYLHETYGMKKFDTEPFNIGKIVRDDMSFIDSKNSLGIQVADLLASSIRRLLRNEFDNNKDIAKLIGKLMLQAKEGEHSIKLISLIDSQISDIATENSIKIIDLNSKPILI